MFKISFSGWNLFKKCERSFYFHYIKNLREYTENQYSLFGNCIHSLLENEYPNELTIDVINKYYSDFKLSQTKFTKDDIIKHYNNVLKLNLDIKEREFEFNTIIYNININGFIDCVLSDGTLIDYKTGSYSKSKFNDYKKQVYFYAIAIKNISGKLPKKAGILFTKTGKLISFDIMEDEAENLLNDLKNDINKILNSKSCLDFNNDGGNCRFCQYKNRCFELEYNKDNMIQIKLTELDGLKLLVESDKQTETLLNKVFGSRFSYENKNAFFANRALNMKNVKYRVPTHIELYKNSITYIGFKENIMSLLENTFSKSSYCNNRIIEIIDNKIINNNIKYINTLNKLNGIELRDFQKEIINTMGKHKVSLIEASVGSGKTVMAAEFIRKHKMKTLFIVDVKVLLEQTKNEFNKLLGMDIGLITEGKQDWKDINIATIQTAVKLLDDVEFIKNLSECGIVIIDEAHTSKSKSYAELIKMSRYRYLIGLTGTAFSNGNDDLELYKIFGFPKVRLKLNDLINMGYAVKPIIEFLHYDTPYCIGNDYNEILDSVNTSQGKVEVLLNTIKKHNNDDILIICKRINHMHFLYDYISNKVDTHDVYVIEGRTSKKKREKILNSIYDNDKPTLIIGSTKIVEKGLNIPKLKVLINYTSNKGDIQTIQMIGRVIRNYEGKDKAYYYDFYDTHNKLKDATKQRIQILEDQHLLNW